MDWAFRECIDHYAYRLPKGRTTCMDCGHGWLMAEPSDSCTCPKCGARLKVRQTFERKLPQKQYFTVLTTSGEYQVLRKFLLVVEMEKGCKAKPYSLEIGQYWWNAQGRMAVVGIQRVLGRYIDTFSFGSPLAVRSDNAAYRHIAYSPIYPKSKVLDVLRRNGFDGDFHDIVENPLKVAPLIQSNLTPVKFFHSFILFILVFFVFFLSVMPGSTLNFVYKYNDYFLLLHFRSDSPKSSMRMA